jgi:NCS1 family nucleobase:cation symporter-1
MTGAGRVLYNEDIWSPIALLSKWTGAGGRACAFICGCLWLLAQLSTNVSANTAPFGHDAMNIAPGWINVRRGSFICFLLGAWAMVPWLTVNSASKFISFMNGYGCFVCVMVSILLADYFLVRRSKLDVPSLYDPRGRYRYKVGLQQQ